jgi:hypothetical protein
MQSTRGGAVVSDDRGGRPPRGTELEDALLRFEDLLLSLPFDRALPDLDDLLRQANVAPELLRRDERAVKLLHEAVVARPFNSLDAVQRVRTEVGLLTLEVELLTDLLCDPAAAPEVVARATGRLAEVRARLEEIRDDL